MDQANERRGAINRRDFIRIGGAAIGGLAALSSESRAQVPLDVPPASRATTPIAGDPDASDILVDTLIAWGATHVFGIVGDGINPIIEALRKRQDRIAFIGVRHEEAAAFMAIGVRQAHGPARCLPRDDRPGAAHLVNGLYDAAYDNAPVLAITGSTFHDLQGMHFMQGVEHGQADGGRRALQRAGQRPGACACSSSIAHAARRSAVAASRT